LSILIFQNLKIYLVKSRDNPFSHLSVDADIKKNVTEEENVDAILFSVDYDSNVDYETDDDETIDIL
jgi:hypothetical protein